jgi:hypothetical protein
MANETLLVISGNGVSPFSARGLSQTLEPIQGAGNLRRTLNGSLRDLSEPQFQKYHSTISCTDQNVPALDGVWPGEQLTIDCVAELSYKTVGGSPGRTVVPGSSRVEGAYTIYRPRLVVRVVNYNENQDEWGATVGWNLEVEEA